MEFSVEVLLLLFAVAIVAGWVDTLAGGGGLLTMPALLLTGMPPAVAIATNKLQGSSGTLTSTLYFVRKGVVDLRQLRLPILFTFMGSVLGSWLILEIDSRTLVRFLPILLILVGLYFLLSPRITDEDKEHRMSFVLYSILVTPLLGFYDGFFGPGTGSFMALSFILLCGYGLARATANAKVLNFTSNISSLMYFVIFGEIYWVVGIVMILGQLIGATLGARMVLSNGAKLIKPIVVLVCFSMAARILWVTFAHS